MKQSSPSPAVNLLDALNDPRSIAPLDGRGWNQLIRLLRQTKSMAKLAHRISIAQLDDQLDPRVKDHLRASRIVAQQHVRAVRWEANRILHALADVDHDIVFLKGAAYVLADLPAGRGRLVSDVDIMVPKAHILDAEQLLLEAGWQPLNLDDYDQRYYRQWMHELPPLRHGDRRNVLDLHHTILPETGRLHPDPASLFAATIPIPGLNNPHAKMLAPIDMVLHSAAHLFQDGDLAGGLRDLLDLDDLLRHFGRVDPTFWQAIVPRAIKLNLQRPLYYALRFTYQLLDTPVPPTVLAQSSAYGPPTLVRWLMDALTHRALVPDAGAGPRRGSEIARWLLYARSHWLRMPPLLLMRHLSHKTMARFNKPQDPRPQTQEEKNVDAKRLG